MSNKTIPKARPFTEEEKKMLENLPPRIMVREMIRKEECDDAAESWYQGEDG